MSSKLKNILIILSIIVGLVLTSQVLADPADKYEEIKAKLDALSLDKCSHLSGQKKIDCIDEIINEINKLKAELDKYAEEIGGKVTELQKDIQSLNNQISYLNAQIEKTQIEIEIREREVNLLELDISKIEEEIKEKENKIQDMKEKMAEAIRFLYEYDSGNLIKLTLAQANLSDLFDEVVYINDLQESIGETLEKLKADKIVLELNRKTLKEREEAISKAREELSLQVSRFDSDKQQKAVLLEITEGDEEKYRELMERIKKETSELSANLNQLIQLRAAEIARYLRQFPKGTCKASINVPYFAQTDPKWANREIGSSGITVGGWGCALTSVAMVFNYYKPGSTNPGIIASFPSCPGSCGGYCGCYCEDSSKIFTSGGCLYWYKVAQKYGFTIDPLSFRLDWDKINYEIGRKNPVIIKTSSSVISSHYVVIVGKDNNDYIVLDPYQSVLGDGTPVGGCVYLHQSLAYAANNGNGSVTQMIIYHP